MLQSIINSGKLERLGKRSPSTAFTGQKQGSYLLKIKRRTGKEVSFTTIDSVRAAKLANLESILIALDNMHREVHTLSSKARKKRVQAHNSYTNIREVNFNLVDFVMKANTTRVLKNKIAIRWYGSMRVTKVISDYIFEVEHLISGKKSISHGTRLKLFGNKYWNPSQEAFEHLKYQDREYC